MKKIVCLLLLVMLFSCKSSSDGSSKKLFEILTEQNNGGASIQFYEILTEENEIKMLLGDENLRKKIKPDDIKKANFVILNLGQKNSGGYSIKIENAIETATQIILTIKEQKPNLNEPVTDVMSNPYTVVKINSKKEIVFK